MVAALAQSPLSLCKTNNRPIPMAATTNITLHSIYETMETNILIHRLSVSFESITYLIVKKKNTVCLNVIDVAKLHRAVKISLMLMYLLTVLKVS